MSCHNNRRSAVAIFAAYFFYFGAIGSWFTFLAVHFRNIGLSSVALSALLTLPNICAALFAASWGLLADRLGRHRVVLQIALLAGAGGAIALITVRETALIFATALFWAFFATPISAFLDSYALRISERSGIAFGRIRLGGTIGFVLTSYGVGNVMGPRVNETFAWVYALCLALCTLCTLWLPSINSMAQSRINLSTAVHALRNPALASLMLAMAVLFAAIATMHQYLGVYLTELGAAPRLIGLSSVVMALSEFPVLLLSRQIIARLGLQRMTAIAIAFYGLRCVALTLIARPDDVLWVQMLNSASFGFYVLAVPSLARTLAGDALAATSQGLLSSAQAIGGIFGLLAAGVLIDAVGLARVYQIAAGLAAIALAIYLIGLRWAASDQSRLAAFSAERPAAEQ
jgi:MFS transporter, PPP family, 3-phenylpropionic acid transporter